MTDDQARAKAQILEELLATAVLRLVRLDAPQAALALAEAEVTGYREYNDGALVDIDLTVPGDYFDELREAAVFDSVEGYRIPGSSVLVNAFTDALPPGVACDVVRVKIRNEPVPPAWRDEFKASMGRGPVNQGNVSGVPEGKFVTHHGLRFRSMTEVVLAQELEGRGILFFPLPVANINGGKVLNEPDFVILHEGRVGILEIHGEPWHPKSRSSEEHAKALPYRLAGAVHLIVDSKQAYEAPGVVVDQMLALMQKSS